MTNRSGNPYRVIRHTVTRHKGPIAITLVRLQLISFARQTRKATGLSGRQWRKWRKALRRADKLLRIEGHPFRGVIG